MGDSRETRGGHREAPRVLIASGMDLDALFHQRPLLKRVALVLYYLAIILTLVLMYGRGDFSTPPFVYQEF